MPGIDDYEGKLYELPAQTDDDVDLEVYRPLPDRLQIIQLADEREENHVIGAADCRFISGAQWHQIIKDRQWKEEGYNDQEEWFKTQSKAVSTAKRYAQFFLFCRECDNQNVDRPTSLQQVKAFEGEGSLTDRVTLWASLTEFDDPLGGRELRRKIDNRAPGRDSDSTETSELALNETHLNEVDEPSETLVTLPSGKQVTPEEAKEVYEKEYANLEKDKEKTKKDQEKAQKAKVAADKAKAKAKEQQEQRQEEVNKEFREAVKASFEEQLAEIHARYGIEETPSIFEVDEEAWKEALANTRNHREEHVLDILSKLFPLVSEMRSYEPPETARACLNWPSPERSKEAIQDIATWLDTVGEEMEAQTTPGVLRAVKGDG